MANANYNDIFTTTLENRSGKIADAVSKNNALLNRLREKGHNRLVYGGSKILEELEYGEGDMSWYSGYDSIEYTPKQLFTAAEYSLKLCAVPVAVSGEDLLKNSGKYQIMDLFEKRIENAQKTMCNKMSEAVYGDGTAASGKAVWPCWWPTRRQPEPSAVSTARLPATSSGATSRRPQRRPLPRKPCVRRWIRCIFLCAAAPTNRI